VNQADKFSERPPGLLLSRVLKDKGKVLKLRRPSSWSTLAVEQIKISFTFILNNQNEIYVDYLT